MTSLILDLTETAIRNGRRDEGKYTFTQPCEIFPGQWLLARTEKGQTRRYVVRVDESNVPYRCNCPAAKGAEEKTGENLCKHQWILADHLRILEEEKAWAETEDLYAKL